MRREFIDFFNHGTLPSVGRERERERIVGFWRLPPSVGGTELRAALLIGEAGVGKSHLIEGAIRAIEAEGGATVHIKLRPEGSASLAPLIDEGLRRSESARRIGGEETVATMREAVARLRRLCSLRRTLLVLEDAHLIAPENVREFSFLVDALRDEPLPLLIAARPQELAIRAIVEGAIREEMTVEGLGRDDLRDLWRLVFGERPTAATLRTLLDATHGNPLAIRSTLRGSIRSGSLETNDEENRSHVTVDIGAFAEIARRSAAGVIVGMTIDLDAAERDAAERLALLGEVFAAEAAAVMVDDADRAIESLLFRGLLATSLTPTTPLDTARSARLPLAFTHTLLHDALITDPSTHADRLVDVIASDAPLYTLRPLRLLASASLSPAVPTERIIAAIERLKRIARLIDNSSEWRHAAEVIDVADRLTEQLTGRVDPVDLRTARASLLSQRIFLTRRDSASPDYSALAAALYRASDDVAAEAYPAVRLNAITHRISALHGKDLPIDDALLREAGELIERYPDLRRSSERISFLNIVGTIGVNRAVTSERMLERVERDLEEMTAAAPTDATDDVAFRREAVRSLGRFLLSHHRTAEQMAKRRELIGELDRLNDPHNPQYLFLRFSFLQMDGQIERIIDESAQLQRLMLDHGHFPTYVAIRQRTLAMQLIAGRPVAEVVVEARDLLAEIMDRLSDDPRVAEYRRTLILLMIYPLALIDRYDRIGEIQDALDLPDAERALYDPLFFHLSCGNVEEALRSVTSDEEEVERLALHVLSTGPVDAEVATAMERVAMALLRDHPFSIDRFGNHLVLLRLVDHGLAHDRLSRSRPLTEEMRASIRLVTDWFAERRIASVVAPFLRRYGGYLPASERKERERLIEEMVASGGYPFDWDRTERLRIRAIDEFAVEGSDRAMHPLRGGRNRIALGTLIAQALLRRPLDRHAFLAQATGIGDDPERARTTWNVIALRLRDALGRDIVRLDDGVPMLDTTQADVDVIAARDLLATCDRERRAGHLLAAREALEAAIDLLGGTILFPGLYDELFETLRDDWQSRLRDTVLSLAAELTKAGDDDGVGELLEAYEAKTGE